MNKTHKPVPPPAAKLITASSRVILAEMRRPRRPWRWTGTWRNCGKDSVFQQPLQRSSNHLTRKKTVDFLEPGVNRQRSGFFTCGRHTREDDTERNARFSSFRRMAAARNPISLSRCSSKSAVSKGECWRFFSTASWPTSFRDNRRGSCSSRRMRMGGENLVSDDECGDSLVAWN